VGPEVFFVDSKHIDGRDFVAGMIAMVRLRGNRAIPIGPAVS
jgi:hypothetical protein